MITSNVSKFLTEENGISNNIFKDVLKMNACFSPEQYPLTSDVKYKITTRGQTLW